MCVFALQSKTTCTAGDPRGLPELLDVKLVKLEHLYSERQAPSVNRPQLAPRCQEPKSALLCRELRSEVP